MFPEHKYISPSSGHMGFVMDKLALERGFFFQYFFKFPQWCNRGFWLS
jgi:hypothetical protein